MLLLSGIAGASGNFASTAFWDGTSSNQGIEFGPSSNSVVVTSVVPEPGTIALLGLSLAGLGLIRRKTA